MGPLLPEREPQAGSRASSFRGNENLSRGEKARSAAVASHQRAIARSRARSRYLVGRSLQVSGGSRSAGISSLAIRFSQRRHDARARSLGLFQSSRSPIVSRCETLRAADLINGEPAAIKKRIRAGIRNLDAIREGS